MVSFQVPTMVTGCPSQEASSPSITPSPVAPATPKPPTEEVPASVDGALVAAEAVADGRAVGFASFLTTSGSGFEVGSGT